MEYNARVLYVAMHECIIHTARGWGVLTGGL